MSNDNLPTPAEIIATHDEIEKEYDLKYKGFMKAAPKSKLRREVIEPAAEYDDPYHRAAVLLFGIQSVHVFEDGNKRTAWTETLAYLERQGITPDFSQDDATIERIVRRAGLFDVDELAGWFETGEIDEDRLPKH
ncbi:MAG TPA: Fic family protein [Halococcus sp.]|nr:Fic family protein [Halococcus sp.]